MKVALHRKVTEADLRLGMLDIEAELRKEIQAEGVAEAGKDLEEQIGMRYAK